MKSLLFFVAGLFPVAVWCSDCDVEPISLALTDVQVLPGVEGSFMRGIPARIGSPAQDIVMLPWAELNNTFIYDHESFCDDSIIWNDVICEVRRGNLYDPHDSQSYIQAADVPTAGGASEETALEGSEKGIGKLLSTSLGASATLSLNGSKELNDFPFGIPRFRWDYGYTFLHSLGMGSNSTYLNALRDGGRISARVWSIFWGRMWNDDPLDGSVVLGGYDSAKVIGNNLTSPLDYTDSDGAGCWTGMKVIVRDIQLNFRDGDDKSISPPNTALPFCIVPQKQLLMEAPRDILELFEAETNTNSTGDSFGLHWSAKLYDKDNYYDGDMTFFLDSGLEIRVPNDQFMTPYVDIDRSGKRIVDDSKREFLMNPLNNQPATLGRYFLTAAYLMVNHDANSFSLWQANPTSSSNLIPVYDEESAAQCNGDVPGLVQPSASPTEDTQNGGTGDSDKKEENEEEGPSSARIGGAVGGVIGGLAILGVVVFFLIRRKRESRGNEAVDAGQTPAHQHYGNEYKVPWSYSPQSGMQEVHGSVPYSYEVAGDEGRRFELDTGDYHRRTS